MSFDGDITEVGEHRVVIDNGSWMIRSGHPGEDSPYSEVRSIHGTPRDGSSKGHIFGDVARHMERLVSLDYPIKDSIIEDFDSMRLFWDYIFEKELKIETKDKSVLLADFPLNPKEYREQLVEEFFEHYQMNRVSIQLSPVLAAFSSGSMTCLSVDVGFESYNIVPVIEGHAVTDCLIKINIGGKDINECLMNQLAKKGIGLQTREGLSIVEQIKTSQCYFRLSDNKDDSGCIYEMPDGQKLNIDECSYTAPECLFNPKLIGKIDDSGLGEYCQIALDNQADPDVQVRLLKNIIVSGNTGRMKGFGERLKEQLKDARARVMTTYNSQNNVWIGGSIFASTITYENNSISKEAYEEFGPDIIHSTIL